MLKLVEFKSIYGSGVEKSFRRYVDTNDAIFKQNKNKTKRRSKEEYQAYLDTLSEGELQEREKKLRERRINKRISTIKQRALSTDSYEYFVTLTTNDEKLLNSPSLLLEHAKQFFNSEGVVYYCQLESYRGNRNGYHIHAVCDKPVDLEKWSSLVNANEKDLYCDVLNHAIYNYGMEKSSISENKSDVKKMAVETAVDYVTKQSYLMVVLFPNDKIYASNVKVVKKKSEMNFVDENTLISSNNSNISSQNISDNANNSSHFADKYEDIRRTFRLSFGLTLRSNIHKNRGLIYKKGDFRVYKCSLPCARNTDTRVGAAGLIKIRPRKGEKMYLRYHKLKVFGV